MGPTLEGQRTKTCRFVPPQAVSSRVLAAAGVRTPHKFASSRPCPPPATLVAPPLRHLPQVGFVSYFHRLSESGCAPSVTSSAALLRAMSAASMYSEAADLFVLWRSAPAPLPVPKFHVLVPGLCSKGAIDKARFLFDAMQGSGLTRPVRVYKSLGFAHCKARRSPETDETCWTQRLSGPSSRTGGWNWHWVCFIRCGWTKVSGWMDMFIYNNDRWFI